MCKRINNRHNRKPQSPRLKFYRNLRSFLVFNLIFTLLSVLGSGFEFWKISAIWGIFLGIGYVKAFGLPGTYGWFSDDWKDWMMKRESRAYTTAEEDAPPHWKEKDLV